MNFPLQDKIVALVPVRLQPHLIETFGTYQINTALRAVHFLAQVSHESRDFKRKEEGLFYTDPERVAKIFKGDFDTNKDKVISPAEIEFAKQFIKNSQKLANYVYANQGGNGNVESGDGWRYRGRGPIQITLKDNYKWLAEELKIDVVADPDKLLDDRIGMLSSGAYWKRFKINEVADLGLTEDVIKKVTKKINPALVGLVDRTQRLNDICNKLQFKA